MRYLFGALVLHDAERPLTKIMLPQSQAVEVRTGQHVSGRYNGSWYEFNEDQGHEIYVPQRYKKMVLSMTDDNHKPRVSYELSELDTAYGDARQLYKLNRLVQSVAGRYAATVNITYTSNKESSLSGAFYLLASQVKLYVCLVFDTQNGSVQLVWSTADIKAQLQATKQYNYAIYEMPCLTDTALFIASQSLTAHWWRFAKVFGSSHYGFLRAANALEMRIYKDPELKSYHE